MCTFLKAVPQELSIYFAFVIRPYPLKNLGLLHVKSLESNVRHQDCNTFESYVKTLVEVGFHCLSVGLVPIRDAFHCRELIGRISILLSWLSVIIIFACWNAFLDIRDAPWWYRIDVSSLWQTTFPTSIMDNYKRFALSKKNTDKMLHKHYKFFIADFQSKFYLFTKSICHNL